MTLVADIATFLTNVETDAATLGTEMAEDYMRGRNIDSQRERLYNIFRYSDALEERGVLTDGRIDALTSCLIKVSNTTIVATSPESVI